MPAYRLMHFDIHTLYELHYQMITLGKASIHQTSCLSCSIPSIVLLWLASRAVTSLLPGVLAYSKTCRMLKSMIEICTAKDK